MKNINLSSLDKERFGFNIAKVSVEAGDSINNIIRDCLDQQVDMLIARCPAEEIHLVQQLEAEGFFLTDTLVYFQNKKPETFVSTSLQLAAPYTWSLASADDSQAVGQVAAKAFANFSGHYHSDTRLEKSDADLVYSSWAENSCTIANVADVVFLIRHQEIPVAFLTAKKINSETCEIVLNGVDPAHQQYGLYNALISLTKNWAMENGMKNILVSTQITNVAPQKVWCRHGFEPLKSFYTFHKWFN